MNKCVFMGRIVRDVETRYTEAGKVVSKFTLALDRPYKKDAPKESDFINCIAFGKTAEVIGNNFVKGKPIAVECAVHTGSYVNKKGDKVYTTDFWVNGFEFVPRSKDDAPTAQPQQGFNANAFGGQQVSGDVEIDF